MKSKHRWAGAVILGLIVLLFLGVSYFFPALKNFSSPAYVRDFLLGWGVWGYLIFIFLVVISIPLPVPSSPIVLGGGYVYGTIIGSLLALVAMVIGGAISFLLVRKFGSSLLEKLVERHHLVHFNHIFKKRGVTAALISYIIPVFPADTIALLMGLTKIRFHTFLAIMVAGIIPRTLILNLLGNDLYTGFGLRTVFPLLLGIIFVLIAIFREKIKRIIFKELKELEAEVEKVEEEVEREIKGEKKKKGGRREKKKIKISLKKTK